MPVDDKKKEPEGPPSMTATYGYILLWITLSAGVIMLNKYVLSYSGFPYPIALTLIHMAFCSAFAWAAITWGFVQGVEMSNDIYYSGVLPIAALFAGTLWLGNAAYLYLTVSFIQMLKAAMPVTVFSVGCLLGTEKYQMDYALTLVVITVGVAVASWGEMHFVLLGVIFQCSSIVTESFRISLIQILLQSRGIRLNPVTTLYYVAPACFVFLSIPFAILELPRLTSISEEWSFNPMLLLASATGALALNLAIFLLIGRTSALTMNVAGVLKDWVLIGLSVLLFKSSITGLQLGGYGVAFVGVCIYNNLKMKSMAQPKVLLTSPRESESGRIKSGAMPSSAEEGRGEERVPLKGSAQ